MAQRKTGNQPKVKKKKPAAKAARTAQKAGSKKSAGARRPSEALRPRILQAAIDIAGRDGWDAATRSAIATEAKVTPEDVRYFYEDIWDILFDVLDDIEDKTQAEVRDYLTDNWRDNLLEILMMRFDLAQEHRAALLALPGFAARHPLHIKRFGYRLCDTMRRMLHLSRLEEERINGLSVGVFSLVYLSLVEKWSKDESPDLATTMAAADKRLGWFEQALEQLDRAAPVRKAARKARAGIKSAKKKIKKKIKEAA